MFRLRKTRPYRGVQKHLRILSTSDITHTLKFNELFCPKGQQLKNVKNRHSKFLHLLCLYFFTQLIWHHLNLKQCIINLFGILLLYLAATTKISACFILLYSSKASSGVSQYDNLINS